MVRWYMVSNSELKQHSEWIAGAQDSGCFLAVLLPGILSVNFAASSCGKFSLSRVNTTIGRVGLATNLKIEHKQLSRSELLLSKQGVEPFFSDAKSFHLHVLPHCSTVACLQIAFCVQRVYQNEGGNRATYSIFWGPFDCTVQYGSPLPEVACHVKKQSQGASPQPKYFDSTSSKVCSQACSRPGYSLFRKTKTSKAW